MDIADVVVYVHPDLSAKQRAGIEEEFGRFDGIISVHFSPGHPHELTVAYDPRTTDSQHILKRVRQWDKSATLVGL